MEQHRKYGDFVQIAPDHVSSNLSEAASETYGHKSCCLKGDFYDSFLQRKFLNPAFSARALSEFESSMDTELSCWRKQLMNTAKSKAVIDFTVWSNYLAFEVIGRFAFGKSFGFIDQARAQYNLIATVDTRGEVLNALRTLIAYLRPWMKYVYFDPFWSAGLRAASNLASLGRAAYFDRKDNTSPQKDLLSYLFAVKDNGDVGEQETIAELSSVSQHARWMETNANELLENCLPFSTGPRACVGRNFVWMEIVKALAIVFKTFDVRRPSEQPTVIREGFLPNSVECACYVTLRE
ncbi:hypothetical protein E8E11_010686 [Didymella keratinophila]|nr:hypothetical protein E8E11_010686 [Didymella keratinophila]